MKGASRIVSICYEHDFGALWKGGRGRFAESPAAEKRGLGQAFSGFLLLLGGGAILQRNRDRAQHIAGGSGFASPDFKLPGGLLHEHFYSGDDGDSLGPRDLQQVRLDRVIHHVEDDAGLDLLVFEWGVARVSHSNRSGVNYNVEGDFTEVGAFDAVRFGLAGELLSLNGSAIQYPDFSTALFETEDSSTGRAPGAEHENFRLLDGETLLERTHHARDIGIKTVKFAILSADDGIAGASVLSR